MPTVTVTGSHFFDASGNPEFGYVTFTPSQTLTDARGNVILNTVPITANVVGGGMTPVPLLATDTASIVQPGWVWQVQEFVSGAGPSLGARAYTFPLPSTVGASADLLALRPAGTAAAVTTVNPMAVSGTPTAGEVLTATSGTAATWQAGGGGGGVPATTVQSATTFGIAPAVGVDTTYAREDHQHGSPSGALLAANNLTDIASPATARGTLTAAKSGANSDITSLTGLSTPLALSGGGTGSATQNFVDLTTGQTIAGVKAFTSPPTGPTPVGSMDLVNKAYADAFAQGLSVKASCQEATTAALPANVYSNGASGVGATLTGVATGTLTVDGVVVALGDRVLVQNEAAAANNGLYSCTTAGATGVAYILTRTADMNTAAQIPGAFVFVEKGTVNAGAGFTVASAGPFTVGTTAIAWTQFSGAGEITAGTGLTKTGNTLALATPVSVANGGIGAATLAAAGLVQVTVVGAPTGTYATDVATVSAAITAAGTYGTLYFPYSATAYNVDGLAPLTGQTWYGNATLQRPASSSASIVTATGISNFTMRQLTIDGNSSSSATSNAAVYLINTTFTLLQNLTVQNCPSANNAIILRGSVRGVIDACQITSCGYGVAIGLNHGDGYSCFGNVIRNTMIDTTTWDAIFLTENLGSTGSVSVVGSVIGTVVTGCTVRNAGDCGIEIGSGTVHTEVSGCDFIGISNGNGNQGILFRDAQHANVSNCTVSNFTKAGSNGVYSVNLNGFNAHNSINNVDVYNCGYGYLVIGGTSPTTIGTAAQDIAINGGIIDTTVADGIQLANVAGFSITGTQIHNAGNQGISVGKVSSTSASDGTITGARVFNSGQQATLQSGIILFQSSADIAITGCRIGDTQGGSKTQAYGIRIFDSTVTNVKIANCDLTNGGTTNNFANNSSAANGIEVYTTTGISPVGLRTAVTRPDATWDATDHGLIAWSYDATLAPEGSSAPINGLVYLVGLQIRGPFTTTKGYFSCSNATTPAGTVAGENFLGLYNSAGTLVASAEIDANLTSFTAGLQTITWSASYTGPAGQYWVALLLNGTTNPTLYRAASSQDNATPNAGITTAANYRICKNGSGATALAAITPSSNTISSSSDSPRNWWTAIG